MMIATFEELLDRHGGDIARWPAADRDAALVLLAGAPEARHALQAVQDVESVLTSTRAMASSLDRIAEIASRQRQTRPIPAAAQRAGWAAAAMIVLVMGIAVGDVRPIHDDGTDAILAASLDATGATDVD